MKVFMDEDFLLTTKTAKDLYHGVAKKMPIIDYHCHISPKEIYEDRKFDTITQLWLEADHYKWRLMRSNGVQEKYITGEATDFEKFQKWAQTLELAIGNPLYHWSHLELKRYFGCNQCLSVKNAKEIWEYCNNKLRTENISARNLIRQSGVELLCTTDDPIDSLEWHRKIAEDETIETQVLPTWRPDKVMNIEAIDYLQYLDRLSEMSGITINNFSTLLQAIQIRMNFFESLGCKLSDHSLPYVMYVPSNQEKIEEIFSKRLQGVMPGKEEANNFKTSLLIAMGKEYYKRNWTMQLHFGVKRDNNRRVYRKLGADAGVDCIDNFMPSSQLVDFLNVLDETNELPKTILYSLNPMDNAVIGTIIGCFQDCSTRGKVQQGSAWWFNDNKNGMKEQLTSFANLSVLGNFIGMLTDSRSFLSYTRHEYFRRILCEWIGNLVENGEYPKEERILKKIVENICYKNAKTYFEFDD